MEYWNEYGLIYQKYIIRQEHDRRIWLLNQMVNLLPDLVLKTLFIVKTWFYTDIYLDFFSAFEGKNQFGQITH